MLLAIALFIFILGIPVKPSITYIRVDGRTRRSVTKREFKLSIDGDLAFSAKTKVNAKCFRNSWINNWILKKDSTDFLIGKVTSRVENLSFKQVDVMFTGRTISW